MISCWEHISIYHYDAISAAVSVAGCSVLAAALVMHTSGDGPSVAMHRTTRSSDTLHSAGNCFKVCLSSYLDRWRVTDPFWPRNRLGLYSISAMNKMTNTLTPLITSINLLMQIWSVYRSSLLHVMAWHLFVAKPLPTPVQTYCQLAPFGTTFDKIWIKIVKKKKLLNEEYTFEIVLWKMSFSCIAHIFLKGPLSWCLD